MVPSSSEFSDKNYSSISISKKDFHSYMEKRYRGAHFVRKIIDFFYPTDIRNPRDSVTKHRYIDFYK